MKFTVLGCGNAFSLKNFNNSFLLEETDEEGNTRRMLIDAGWALPYALQNANIDAKSIDDVYISHLHADHVGGLEYLALMRYDWMNKPSVAGETAPTLIANERLMKELWEKTLRGGLETLEGIDCKLETFFKLRPIAPNERFEWMGWECRLVQQIHIMAGSMISNTFGMILKKEGHKTLYLVTDSQHCSPHQLEVFYREADIIIQDCELVGLNVPTRRMQFCSHVHANYGQLAGYDGSNSSILPDEIKEKMYLGHYQDFYDDGKDFFGNECDWDALAREDGFAGFLHVGMTLEM